MHLNIVILRQKATSISRFFSVDLNIFNAIGELVPGDILDAQMFVYENDQRLIDSGCTGEFAVGKKMNELFGFKEAFAMLLVMGISITSEIWKLGRTNL